MGYSTWDCKELDTIEPLIAHPHPFPIEYDGLLY